MQLEAEFIVISLVLSDEDEITTMTSIMYDTYVLRFIEFCHDNNPEEPSLLEPRLHEIKRCTKLTATLYTFTVEIARYKRKLCSKIFFHHSSRWSNG